MKAAWVKSDDYKSASRTSKPTCRRIREHPGELDKAEQMLSLIATMMPVSTPANADVWSARDSASPPPDDPRKKLASIWTFDTEQHPVLSKLIYSVETGDGERQEVASYIESLVGPLRHPYHCLRKEGKERMGLLDTSYLLFDRRLPPSGRLPANDGAPEPPTPFATIYFDLGATRYPRSSASAMMGWGTSQGFFPAIFSRLGLPFDSMSLWEVQTLPPESIFANVPGDLLHGYQYFNIPVAKLRSKDREWNALRVLRGKVQTLQRQFKNVLSAAGVGDDDNEEDGDSDDKVGVSGSPPVYVVFKLDIDSPIPEKSVVRRLLEVLPAEASRLPADEQIEVNEFLFEHHTDILDVVGPNWCSKDCPTLADSYEVFQNMRRRGVRAHSWI